MIRKQHARELRRQTDTGNPSDQINKEKSRLTSHYKQYQIFPRDYFKEVEGFSDFLDTGYEKYLKSLAVTPYKVLRQEPFTRTRAELKIFQEYCQKFEDLAGKDDEFYRNLHHGVRVAERFKKGEFIEPDPSVIRILWSGNVIPLPYETSLEQRQQIMAKNNTGGKFTMTGKCLPRHYMIITD